MLDQLRTVLDIGLTCSPLFPLSTFQRADSKLFFFSHLNIDIALVPHCDLVTNGQTVARSTLKGLHSFDDVLHLPDHLRTQFKGMEYFPWQKISEIESRENHLPPHPVLVRQHGILIINGLLGQVVPVLLLPPQGPQLDLKE